MALLVDKIARVSIVSDMVQRMAETRKNKEKVYHLCKYLLPSHILLKFYHNPDCNQRFTEECEAVTVLFADIAGFTKYSASVEAKEVLSMLKALFTEFDKAAFKHRVYKLYTIGDCYVAMGMVDYSNRFFEQEARNIVLLGLEMIKIIEKVRGEVGFEGLNMRIGAHTGSIIGGVIGTDIIRYDIYGRNVSIANKMESLGSEGAIMVTQDTRDYLSDRDFDFQEGPLCEIEASPIQAYYVREKTTTSPLLP